MKSFFLLALAYLYGVGVGLVLLLLRMVGLIVVKHPERFPSQKGGILLVANHPSVLEPFLLVGLFTRKFLLDVVRYGPWSAPDERNFLEHSIWRWLRERMIPIPRDDRRRLATALRRMMDVLSNGGNLILHPERGRTSTGERNGETLLLSPIGRHKMRKLTDSLGWLALKTGAVVVPVWVDGTDKIIPPPGFRFAPLGKWGRVTFKIGHPMKFEGNESKGKEQVTREIEVALLQLADEE